MPAFLTALDLMGHHHQRVRDINMCNRAANRISCTDREGSETVPPLETDGRRQAWNARQDSKNRPPVLRSFPPGHLGQFLLGNNLQFLPAVLSVCLHTPAAS